jgi:hypothetical protein
MCFATGAAQQGAHAGDTETIERVQLADVRGST